MQRPRAALLRSWQDAPILETHSGASRRPLPRSATASPRAQRPSTREAWPRYRATEPPSHRANTGIQHVCRGGTNFTRFAPWIWVPRGTGPTRDSPLGTRCVRGRGPCTQLGRLSLFCYPSVPITSVSACLAAAAVTPRQIRRFSVTWKPGKFAQLTASK